MNSRALCYLVPLFFILMSPSVKAQQIGFRLCRPTVLMIGDTRGVVAANQGQNEYVSCWRVRREVSVSAFQAVCVSNGKNISHAFDIFSVAAGGLFSHQGNPLKYGPAGRKWSGRRYKQWFIFTQINTGNSGLFFTLILPYCDTKMSSILGCVYVDMLYFL